MTLDSASTQMVTATTVVPETVTTPQDTISGHLETEDDVDYFRVVVGAGESVRRWQSAVPQVPLTENRW